MTYVKTGTIKSKTRDIERGMFKNMSTSRIIYGSIRELYRRYDTETWTFIAFGSIAYQIWYKLGL
jgi:hypothetical protein